MKFKNYRNSHNNDSKIYSEDDIWNMRVSQVFGLEKEILAQNRQIGIPEVSELQSSDNVIWIDSYTRDDGTKVEGHWRSLPDGAHHINPERQNVLRKQNSGTTGAAAQVTDDETFTVLEGGIEYNDYLPLQGSQEEKNKELIF